MALLSRQVFELRIRVQLDQLEPGLAGRVRRKVGFAWRPIVDKMYRRHGTELNFSNQSGIISGCATALRRLDESVEG